MASTSHNDLTFHILRSKAALEEIEPKWNALFEESAHGSQLFLSFNWLWHWVNLLQNPADELLIAIASKEGQPVIIAPLCLQKRMGLKIITWAGAPVSQYGDILIREDVDNLSWLKEAFKYLVEEIRPDIFHLRKVRFDAAITPFLENNAATILEETAAPYIEILGAENFTEFNKRYSQRSRKAKRRHRRKLEEHGTLGFHIYTEGPAAEKAASKAISLKRQWLKEMNIIAPAFSDTSLDDFFKAAAASTTRPVGLKVSELTVNGAPVALEIGIEQKNHYGAHLGAYDPAFTAHSPGTLQMQDTIAALIEEGVEIIDLFAPGDSYKFEWTGQSVPVYDFAYPISLIGRLYEALYLKRLRPGLKRLAAKLSRK